MCNGNRRQPSENSSHPQGDFWHGIYPDISEFFQTENATPRNLSETANIADHANNPSTAMLLMQLLGINPDQFNSPDQPRQTQDNSAPSAPFQESDRGNTNDNSTNGNSNTNDNSNNGNNSNNNNNNGQQQHCNCGGGRQQQPRVNSSDILPILINKFRNFTTVFSRTMSTFLAIAAITMFLFALPHCLISNIVFMVIAACLGLHIPSIIAGKIILSIMGTINPALVLIIFGLWAYKRHVIKRQPMRFQWNFCHRRHQD